MFVLNVDELIYESCCMASIIRDVDETKCVLVLSSVHAQVCHFPCVAYLPCLYAELLYRFANSESHSNLDVCPVNIFESTRADNTGVHTQTGTEYGT